MDTTTTKETTKAPEREKTLSDDIRALGYEVTYIEQAVDERDTLYEGSIEYSLEKCFDLKKQAKRDTPEWRMIRRLINRLIACAADARRL